jgi:hyperpolarization activated cyclic nucleotide-gated potassium channel 2
VRNFYRIQFAEGKMYDEDEVLKMLPPNLRDDILSFNQRLLFEQVPLLSGPNTPDGLRSRLAPLLEKRVMFAGEEIFEEGALGTELYFIVSGIVEVFSQFSTSIVKAISDGCYFGDVAVLLGGRRTASTRARTNLVLSVIPRAQVLEIINEFPLVHKYMVYIAEKRRLRLVSLDPDSLLPPLTSEQMKDEEDSQTK